MWTRDTVWPEMWSMRSPWPARCHPAPHSHRCCSCILLVSNRTSLRAVTPSNRCAFWHSQHRRTKQAAGKQTKHETVYSMTIQSDFIPKICPVPRCMAWSGASPDFKGVYVWQWKVESFLLNILGVLDSNWAGKGNQNKTTTRFLQASTNDNVVP